ncbi:putative integral membrane protein [Babesia bovis T2Bo]|uniref:Uncharacterized protein n=1 Tax=Babesia bovis TaxID=5865 RepID=A7AWC9_BABBO|nr:putative integral membrane protein [Babesia bovis T2Bo]EDO05357.1 putative integral membrane protein [Babesia bovis T2Bo]|eukprot:XP_001608925.1 hypothetical protein [Babesia bovis T2Bo]
MIVKCSLNAAKVPCSRSFVTAAHCGHTSRKPFNGVISTKKLMNSAIDKRAFGSYIENYYTTNHASTGFSSPLRKTFIFMVFTFQAVFTFGYLFHTNYYFTGKALPKPEQSSQLCSDSK